MRGNLENVQTLAGKITKSDVSKALISHLGLNPANVLTLDTQPGILNLVGGQIATYDHATWTAEASTPASSAASMLSSSVQCASVKNTALRRIRCDSDPMAATMLRQPWRCAKTRRATGLSDSNPVVHGRHS